MPANPTIQNALNEYVSGKIGRPVMDTGEPPTGGDKDKPKPPERIPLPDYNDPQSRLNYAKAWVAKYGSLMEKRGDTPLRINEKPEWGTASAKELSIKAAKNVGLNPALLYASAMEEGMSGLYPRKFEGKADQVDFSGDDAFPVSGFVNFGVDNFSDAYAGLVKKGYLPADFNKNFKKSVETNEKKQKVNSANFKDADSALQAKAAMVKASEDEIKNIASKNKIDLSDKAKEFFTLVTYNAGSGNAEKMLKEYSKSGYLKDDKFLDKRPSDSWKAPYENTIRRVKMRDALKKEGYFDEDKPASK
jgi:hypothetical protein